MPYCANCGSEIKGDPKFCPFCGYEQTARSKENRPSGTNAIRPPASQNPGLSRTETVGTKEPKKTKSRQQGSPSPNFDDSSRWMIVSAVFLVVNVILYYSKCFIVQVGFFSTDQSFSTIGILNYLNQIEPDSFWTQIKLIVFAGSLLSLITVVMIVYGIVRSKKTFAFKCVLSVLSVLISVAVLVVFILVAFGVAEEQFGPGSFRAGIPFWLFIAEGILTIAVSIKTALACRTAEKTTKRGGAERKNEPPRYVQADPVKPASEIPDINAVPPTAKKKFTVVIKGDDYE